MLLRAVCFDCFDFLDGPASSPEPYPRDVELSAGFLFCAIWAIPSLRCTLEDRFHAVVLSPDTKRREWPSCGSLNAGQIGRAHV